MQHENPKHEQRDKDAEKERPKRPPGWRNFQKVLKQVIKAPPMRKVAK
jgi:hypothetical protein